MHGITEEFLAGRLTLSRVLSGVCAALYLSLIFQPSSEDVCPRRSQRTMGTGRRGGCGADELGLQELGVSIGDVDVTRELEAVLSKLGIALLDHVIVADDDALSMLEYGLLEHQTEGSGICSRVADPGGEVTIRHRIEKYRKRGNQ